MEEKSSLGIFLLRDKAVAIWSSPDAETAVLHTLSVVPSDDEPAALPVRAARACLRQGYLFEDVFVAIDCGCYTQYNLHSEFNDLRQIESTIKFDAEEAATVDVTNLAVTFEVTDMQETGSQLTAYTADRQLMTDMLLDLQEGGLDPLLMEPDVVCLRRALEQTSKLSDRPDSLFVILSGSNCYMLRPNPGFSPTVRTFLLGRGGDTTGPLIREVLLAAAANHQESVLQSVVLMGDVNTVHADLLKERTGLNVLTETPEKTIYSRSGSESETIQQTADSGETGDDEITAAEILIAYGASIAGRTRGRKTDFRKDFMPYQGKRKVMEGSLHLIGISLTVLLLAVAVFFQLKAFNMKGYANRLEDKMLSQYKAVMYGKSPPGGAVITKLNNEYTKAQSDKVGGGDEKSVPSRLTFFLEAVNRCGKNADIKIQQVSITERSMKVRGDTNNRTATNALLNEIKKHPNLSLGTYRYDREGNRDTFDITVEPTE